MADEQWPVATPRDEVLARVAARGTRIRAVRGALNALAVLTVVGVSTLGVGAAVRAVTDGSPATEVDNVAIGPEPPEVGAPDRPGTTGTRPDGSSTPDTPGTGGSTTSRPDGTRSTTTAGGGPGSGPTATAPSAGPGSSAGSSSTTATTAAPSSTSIAPSTSAPAPAPAVGNLRMKTDGVPTDQSVCENEPDSIVTVQIEGADTATLSWNRAGETRTVAMNSTNSDWWAPLGEIDDQASDVPVIVTIEATGPGGTTRASVDITVADCSPLPSAPSEPGS